MDGATILGLAGVFPDQLPVTVLHDCAFKGDYGIPQVMRLKMRARYVGKGVEVGGVIGKTDAYQSSKFAAMRCRQTMLLGSKSGPKSRAHSNEPSSSSVHW